MQGLVPSLPSSREVVHLLGVVACCSDCSSTHNPDCSDYSEYYATLGLDIGSDSCFPHTDLVAMANSD